MRAFTKLFGDAMTNELSSQLILAFATIVRCGKDRAEFTTNVDSICGGAFDEDEKEQLSEAFHLIACGSPNYKSEAKSRGGKFRPAKVRKSQASSSGNVPHAAKCGQAESEEELHMSDTSGPELPKPTKGGFYDGKDLSVGP